MSRAGQKRLKQVGYRLTADRARPFQATGALDARGLMATRYKRRVNRSVKANAARVIPCVAWACASALPLLYVLVKVDHEIARVLQRGCPFTVIRVIPQHIVKEASRMLPNDKDPSVNVLNEVRKRLKVA